MVDAFFNVAQTWQDAFTTDADLLIIMRSIADELSALDARSGRFFTPWQCARIKARSSTNDPLADSRARAMPTRTKSNFERTQSHFPPPFPLPHSPFRRSQVNVTLTIVACPHRYTYFVLLSQRLLGTCRHARIPPANLSLPQNSTPHIPIDIVERHQYLWTKRHTLTFFDPFAFLQAIPTNPNIRYYFPSNDERVPPRGAAEAG